MKEIHMTFRKLLSSSYLVLIVLLFQCDDSDCNKDLRIVKVLPNRNPIAAPILIKGKSFSKSTKVTFKQIESEVTVVNDSTITTSAPIELKETVGLVELRVIEGNCNFTTDFTLTDTFEDTNRASPPTIFFPNPSEKVPVVEDFYCEDRPDGELPDFDCGWTNIWGGNQSFRFTLSAENNVFTGSESIISPQSPFEDNPILGRVMADRSIEIETSEDNLQGAFYKTTLLTTEGMVSDTFLFLQSTVTGRQYIFRQ